MLDLDGAAVARACSTLIVGIQNLGMNGAVLCLNPLGYERELCLNALDRVSEFLLVDHDLRVGIIQEIHQLVIDIPIIYVNMGERGFKGGGNALGVLWAIAHVKSDFISGFCAACKQRSRQVVGPNIEIAVGDQAFAID